MTHAQLKAAIARWLDRTDLTSDIPTFIQLAESDIRNDVRVRAMEFVETGTLSGSTLAHPARMVEAKRLVIGGQLFELATTEYTTNEPDARNVFANVGQAFQLFGAEAGASYSLTYWRALDALNLDADTNFVLENAADVYLFACCKHGSIFLKDDADAAKFDGLYSAAVNRLNLREKHAMYSGATLTVGGW